MCLCRAWNLEKPIACFPSMPFDLWKIGNKGSITKTHIEKVQSYYKARVIGYSSGNKKPEMIESNFELFEPLLSPIAEEVTITDERLKMAVQLFIKLTLK